MAEADTGGAGPWAGSLSQSIDGFVVGSNGGVTGNNVGRDLNYHYHVTPTVRRAVELIDSDDPPATQLAEFVKWSQDERRAILCEVRTDRAVSLIAGMAAKPDLRPSMMELLERASANRVIELLGPSGLRQTLAAWIILRLSRDRAHHLVSLLAARQPEPAARLIECVAGLKPDSEEQAGPARAAEVFPGGDTGTRVLAALSDSPVAGNLLVRLPRDLLTTLLPGLRPDELCRRLRHAPRTVLGALSEADESTLPMADIAQVLNDLDGDRLAQALCTLGPARSQRWLNLMPERRTALILDRGMGIPGAASMLDAMERGRAARVLRAVGDERRAAAMLERVDRGTATDLLRVLATTDHADWAGALLVRMPNRLVGALLVWIALQDAEAAKRLRVALAARQPGRGTPAQVWRFGPTGWPALDACLMMLSIAGLVRRGPGGSRTTVDLWRCLRDEASPPDYRKQRTILAAVLPVAFLAGVVAFWDGPAPAPARSAPLPSPSVIERASEPAGSPQLAAYRADWPAPGCTVWRRDTTVTLDPAQPSPVEGMLRMRCSPQNAEGYELAVVWYPPAAPGTDRFTGRPKTTLGPALPWSTADGTRQGTYLKYYPEKDKAAIWLEDQREPVALMLFGPPKGGDVFAQLEHLLDTHGYRLS
ncbi:hypothetical protein AB0F81_03505 [Actinoplanes sp. NPDC024001]|uniref:hypothetical protein n=1 Tax=Actinoplanes sp. NPDC024001 TaxID=3154598 RepID=UPI0033DA4B3B